MNKWETIRLGDAATFVNGYAFKPSDWKSQGKEIIRIQNLTKSSKEVNYFDGIIPDRYLVKEGDLLISWSATLGIFEWEGEDAWLNQHIFKVVFDKEDFDKLFFMYLISSLLEKMKSQAHGATMKHITKKKFDSIKIPLPPLSEQKRIAGILDKADALRKKTREIIRQYDLLAQSIFLEMFGDPQENPKQMKIVQLEDVSSKITDGVHAKPDYTETGIPFISVKDITTGELKFDKCKFVSQESHNKYIKRCNPEYLDILYTKVGATYGRPALVNVKHEFSIYVSVALIKPLKEIINPIFLKQCLANPAIKRQADRSIKGIGVPDLHLNMIKKFIIPLPELEEQNKFATIVQNIEKQKSLAKQSLQESEDLFQGLLQKAFKGELL